MFFLVDGSVNATDTVVEGRDFENLSGKLSEGCRIIVVEIGESGPGQRVCAAQEMGQQKTWTSNTEEQRHQGRGEALTNLDL